MVYGEQVDEGRAVVITDGLRADPRPREDHKPCGRMWALMKRLAPCDKIQVGAELMALRSNVVILVSCTRHHGLLAKSERRVHKSNSPQSVS